MIAVHEAIEFKVLSMKRSSKDEPEAKNQDMKDSFQNL